MYGGDVRHISTFSMLVNHLINQSINQSIIYLINQSIDQLSVFKSRLKIYLNIY